MSRRGFTIVEVLVAIVLLAIGVLGIAGVSAMALRQTSIADQQNVAALVAQSRMERYRGGLTCPAIDAQLPVNTSDRGVSVNISPIATGFTRTRVIVGSFTWTTSRGQVRRIVDTTTVSCG